MDQAAVSVGTEMRLHAEMLLVVLPRRAHLRIALAFLVLGRRWGGNQRRIDHRPLLEQEPAIPQLGIDLSKEGVGRLVALEQVAELADRGLVGDRVDR